MGSFIKLGDYKANYKFIFLSCFFGFLTTFLSDYLNEIFISSGIIGENTEDLSRHEVIEDIFDFFCIIIISLILYKNKEKKSNTYKQNHEDINNKINNNNFSEIILIHNDVKDKININISFLNLFFILSYWVLIDHITNIIQSLMVFDYSMFELLFISIIASKILKIEIYSHHNVGIFINSLSCLILGILRFIFAKDNNKNFNFKYKWFNLIFN